MNNRIVLMDPSLRNNSGEYSINLGDVIIYDSISKILLDLFPRSEICRISTHSYLRKIDYSVIDGANFVFLGGSNIISSHLLEYNQWKISFIPKYLLKTRLRNIISLGVGWWQYQDDPDLLTRRFYNTVLSKIYSHSVRDGYTKNMFEKMGLKNVYNTSCPTVWNLHAHDGNRKNLKTETCLLTLTDYKTDPTNDEKLINILLSFFKKIVFFPQGSGDVLYLNSLEVYKKNKKNFLILERNVDLFVQYSKENVCFVGTRLHGGIKCMQNKLDSLILAVDNRAIEISKDINLPVINRDNFHDLKLWLNGNIIFDRITLPIREIYEWKKQFNG